MAASSLISQNVKYMFTAEQLEELRDKASASNRNATAAISKSYASVFVPLRTKSKDTPYSLTSLDLRTMVTANRSLHERVVTALEPYVFGTLAAARLVALAGLGPDRKIVACGDLIDWFYSYFEFTKIWDKRAIASAISRAVAESLAGYTVGLVRSGDTLTLRNPGNIHIGTTIPSDEIDMSDEAALIWADYAVELVANNAEPTSTGDANSTTGSQGTGIASQPNVADPKAKPGSSKEPSADVIQSADISAQINRDGLFDLQRSLAWLRDKPVTVVVDVRIHVEGNLSRTEFRNAVIEPIEEHGDDVSVNTS
jgi:hypothetical protein